LPGSNNVWNVEGASMQATASQWLVQFPGSACGKVAGPPVTIMTS